MVLAALLIVAQGVLKPPLAVLVPLVATQKVAAWSGKETKLSANTSNRLRWGGQIELGFAAIIQQPATPELLSARGLGVFGQLVLFGQSLLTLCCIRKASRSVAGHALPSVAVATDPPCHLQLSAWPSANVRTQPLLWRGVGRFPKKKP